MSCRWLFLASRTAPERFCGLPGHPYCPEHQREMDYIHRLGEDWEEIEATHKAICEETWEDSQLCAACNGRPTHVDCIYCEELIGPQVV
jgi:hypothetical protein